MAEVHMGRRPSFIAGGGKDPEVAKELMAGVAEAVGNGGALVKDCQLSHAHGAEHSNDGPSSENSGPGLRA